MSVFMLSALVFKLSYSRNGPITFLVYGALVPEIKVVGLKLSIKVIIGGVLVQVELNLKFTKAS